MSSNKSFHPDPLATNEENRQKYLKYKKRIENNKGNAEDRLQCEMVVEYRNRFPEEAGRLIGNDSTTMSPQHAEVKNSRGLVRGVADLFFFKHNRDLVAMEIKYPDTDHDREHIIEQAKWLINFPKFGYFVDSMAMFWNIVLNDGIGIDPKRVLENCMQKKTTSVKWEDVK